MLSILTASLIAASTLGQLSINMDAATANYRDARASGEGKMILIGDSLTFGANAIWGNMQEISAAEFGSSGGGYQAVSWWTGASYSLAQWDHGQINTDTAPHRSLDGLWVTSHPTVGATLTMTAWNQDVTLHYVTADGGGSFTVTAGGDVYTVSTDCGQGVGLLDVQLPPSRVFTVQTAGDGPVTLLGVENRTAPLSGPIVHRAANGGWGLDEVLRRDWSWELQLRRLKPELVVITMGGQNDWAFSWQPETWELYMNAVCSRVQFALPRAGIVLVSNYQSSPNPEIIARFQTLSNIQRDIATSRGYGFVDLLHAGGTYQEWLANGFLQADGLHFTDAGGYHAASIIHCAINTGSVCLSSSLTCDSPDFNNDGVFPDGQDVTDFFSVLGGDACAECNDIDFNNNGIFPEDQDIADFMNVLAGGSC